MTDLYARGAGTFQGQPWVTAIPQPWEQQPYSPYEHRQRFDPDISIDPGIHVSPDTEWNGDPGIYVDPPQGWGGDPGIVGQPRVTLLPGASDDPRGAEPVDAVGSIDAGAHVKHGATSLIVPGLAGGALTGAFASAAAPAGLKGATFAGRVAASTVTSVLTGAAMGLAVAASSPTDQDSLAARYAVAGGTLGLVGGAIAPGGMRGVSMVIGGAGNAAIGWYVGRSLETRAKADAAAAAANVQLDPTSSPAFPTISA
ncbi:MAG: hypothetical protein JWL76_1882 [Thermoleophilia bacterium]|nr:hypothetical protein [Thermoleophilia bacterium]